MKSTIQAPHFEISRKTISILTLLALSAGKIDTAQALTMFDDTGTFQAVHSLSKTHRIQQDTLSHMRQLISSNFGDISTVDALHSILEDARGACIGSLRCAVATSQNLVVYEERFKDFNQSLDTSYIGDYALSISGNPDKARLLMLADTSKPGSHEYLLNTATTYSKQRAQNLKQQGLTGEAQIASNLAYTKQGNYTALVMNPHPTKSLGVMKEGISLLQQVENIRV